MSKRITSVKITDRNGKKTTISEPLFGRIDVINEGGRTVIIKKGFWGEERIIPSNEDTLRVKKR